MCKCRRDRLSEIVLVAFCSYLLPAAAQADEITSLHTLGPIESGIEGLETEFAAITVDAGRSLGSMPPIQGDLSQGAETGDPLFYEEMEHFVAELNPQLVRVAPFAAIDSALSLDEQGRLKIDFSRGDRIIASLRRAGARICWNCASWPKEWSEGHDRYPKDLDLWALFIRQVVERYNGQGTRQIDYIEFWNEPAGFNTDAYERLARTATDVDPGIRVGAPAVMDLKLSAIEKAVAYCHETGTPLHFISFHLYYKPPWEWPELIEKAQQTLDKYPGMESLEMLITEWGIDAGESGSCDTRFNAAYYSSVLERMLPHWPRVRPMHFELRDGWDWKGPSRDLFGRWGMLTYSNLLPKPVFQAARMWARMAPNRVQCESADPRIRAVAAAGPAEVTLLLWSYPREYQTLQANDPAHGPSVLDIPVAIEVAGLPFESPGILYERYALDHVHSNVSTDYGRSGLECVHQIVMTRASPGSGFSVKTVLPLHGVSLIVLRPAEGAPVDVTAEADRYQIWAGHRAELTIRPAPGEDFRPELVSVDSTTDEWEYEIISQDPLQLRVRPRDPGVRGQRFFTAWVRRPDWRAVGRAVAEFRTDMPVEVDRDSWRIDLPADSRVATVEMPWTSRAPTAIDLRLDWKGELPLTVEKDRDNITVPALGTVIVATRVSVPKEARPGPYQLLAIPNTGVELPTVETTVYLPMPSAYTSSPPRIDGRLDEWRDMAPLVVENGDSWGGHHASRWDGPDDLTGRAWSRWDDENLYFAFEVVDDHHDAPFANAEMHKFDCVHVGFDLRRDALDPSQFFIEDDCHYGIAATDGGTVYRFWGARRREEIAGTVQVAAIRTGTTTSYEVALPWEAEFSPYAGPRANHVMGMSILFRDKDPDEQPGYLAWGGGLAWHEIRPALFYSIQLMPD